MGEEWGGAGHHTIEPTIAKEIQLQEAVTETTN